MKDDFGRDPFFGEPYVDVDEWREGPRTHRYVHGGFKDTDTRFSFYFPPAGEYDGRFIHMFQGGTGGTDATLTTPGPFSRLGGSLDMYFEFGAYALECNQGHISTEILRTDMPGLKGQGTILNYRANAESARFAAALATEMYGTEPTYGYGFGGSGGGHRSVRAIEYAPGVYDGVVPFMIPQPIYPQMGSVVSNASRTLHRKIGQILDAVEPGGSGDPYAGLDVRERDALSTLFAFGYPRQAIWLVHMMAVSGGRPVSDHYVEAFWNSPGYEGTEGLLDDLLVDERVRVRHLVTIKELMDDPGADELNLRAGGPFGIGALPPDTVVGVQLEGFDTDRLWTAERIAGNNTEVGVRGVVGDTIVCGGSLDGLAPGDEVGIDNRAALARCFFYRHHVDTTYPEFAQPMSAGKPIYAQQPWVDRVLDPSYMNEPVHRGRFAGKMILQQHAVDGSLCAPNSATYYHKLVQGNFGDELDAHFRLWFTENAHHTPADMVADSGGRASSTRLINYMGCIEQGLAHVIDWVELGIEPPASTPYREVDGGVVLPGSASERHGIQPSVRATISGKPRADVAAGEEVTIDVWAEMPPSAGRIVSADCDVDGSGSFAYSADGIDGTTTTLAWSVTHRFERAGTYFPAVRVRSHRDGRLDVPERTVENLGRVRVVVE
jgi:Tannase-like family of unknown function (DUF6351)